VNRLASIPYSIDNRGMSDESDTVTTRDRKRHPHSSTLFDHLRTFGYAMLRGVFATNETDRLVSRLTRALETGEPSVLRTR
jgi:hypothetical protein